VKKTILLSLSLLLLLVVKPTLQVSAGRGLPVHISQGGEVDNEVVNVSRSAADEVVWSSDGDEFTISFQTSPFAASTFHVPAGGSASSGAVSRVQRLVVTRTSSVTIAMAKVPTLTWTLGAEENLKGPSGTISSSPLEGWVCARPKADVCLRHT